MLVDRLRQAAIVIQSLDSETATALLAHLPDDLVARIRQLAETLDDISTSETERVLESFVREQGLRLPNGIEVDPSLVARLSSESNEPLGALAIPNDNEREEQPFSEWPLARTTYASYDQFTDRVSQSPQPTPNTQKAEEMMGWQSWSTEKIAAVLVQIDAEVAAVALATSEPGFAARMLRILPRDLRRQLRTRIEHLGPIRLRDVDWAHARMMQAETQRP